MNLFKLLFCPSSAVLILFIKFLDSLISVRINILKRKSVECGTLISPLKSLLYIVFMTVRTRVFPVAVCSVVRIKLMPAT